MAQARVEIVFSERRQGASVAQVILKDLAALQKAQLALAEFPAIAPRVDESELHSLNELLDIKLRHIDEVVRFAKAHPVVITTRMEGFDDVLEKIKSLQGEVNLKVSTDQGKAGGTDGVPLVDEIVRAIQEGFASVNNKGLLGSLLSPLGSVFKGVFAGATEGIGRELTRELGQGITEGLSLQLTDIFGGGRLLGKSGASALSQELIRSVSGDVEFTLVKQIFRDLLGEGNILAASGAAQGKAAATKADERVAAQDFFAIERRTRGAQVKAQAKEIDELANSIAKFEAQFKEAKAEVARKFLSDQLLESRLIAPVSAEIASLERQQKLVERKAQQLRKQEEEISFRVETDFSLPIEEVIRLEDELNAVRSSADEAEQRISDLQAQLERFAKLREGIREDPLSVDDFFFQRRSDLSGQLSQRAEEGGSLSGQIQDLKVQAQDGGLTPEEGASTAAQIKELESKLRVNQTLQNALNSQLDGLDAQQRSIQALLQGFDKSAEQVLQKQADKIQADKELLSQKQFDFERLTQPFRAVESLGTALLPEARNALIGQREREKAIAQERRVKIAGAGKQDAQKIKQLQQAVDLAQSEGRTDDADRIRAKITEISERQIDRLAAIRFIDKNISKIQDELEGLQLEAFSTRPGKTAPALPKPKPAPKVEKSLKTNPADDIVNFILEQVAYASGLAKGDIKTPKVIQNPNLDPQTAGEYRRTSNTIEIRPEQYQQLQEGRISDQLVDTLVHELRHAIQLSFGQIGPADAIQNPGLIRDLTEEEALKIAKRIEGSARAVSSDPRIQRGARILERDAYAFGERNTPAIQQSTQQFIAQRQFEDTVGTAGGRVQRSLAISIRDANAKIKGFEDLAPIPLGDIFEKAIAEITQEAKELEPLIRQAARLSEMSASDINDLAAEFVGQLSVSIGLIDDQVKKVQAEVVAASRRAKEARDDAVKDYSKQELRSLARSSGIENPEKRSRKQLIQDVQATPLKDNYEAFQAIQRQRLAKLAARQEVQARAAEAATKSAGVVGKVLSETAKVAGRSGASLLKAAGGSELVQRSLAGFGAAAETAGNLLAVRASRSGQLLLGGSVKAAGGLVKAYRALEALETAVLSVNPLFLTAKGVAKNIALPIAATAAASQLPVLGPAIEGVNSLISGGASQGLSSLLGYTPDAVSAVGGGFLSVFQNSANTFFHGMEGQVIQLVSNALAPIITGNLALGTTEGSLKLAGDRLIAAADSVSLLPPAQEQPKLSGKVEPAPVKIEQPLEFKKPIKLEPLRQPELVEVLAPSSPPQPKKLEKAFDPPQPKKLEKAFDPPVTSKATRVEVVNTVKVDPAGGDSSPKKEAVLPAPKSQTRSQKGGEIVPSSPFDITAIQKDPKRIAEEQGARLKFISDYLKIQKGFSKSQPQATDRSIKEDIKKLKDAIAILNTAIQSLEPKERTTGVGAELARLKGQASKLLKSAEAAKEKPTKVAQKAAQGTVSASEVAAEIERLGVLFRDLLKGQIPGNPEAEARVRASEAIALKDEIENAQRLLLELQRQGQAIAQTPQEERRINDKAKAAKGNVTRSGKNADKAIAAAEKIGTEVSTGYSQGLESGIERALQIAALLANKTVEELRDELQIRSPSRLTQEIGEFFVGGFAKGLERFNNLQIAKLLAPSLDLAETQVRDASDRIRAELEKISNITPDKLVRAAKSEKGQAILKDLAVNTVGTVGSAIGGSQGQVGALAGDLIAALSARLAIVTGEAIYQGFKQVQGTDAFESADRLQKAAIVLEQASENFRRNAEAIGKDLTGDLAGFSIGNIAAKTIGQATGIPLTGAVAAAGLVPKVQAVRDRFGQGSNLADTFTKEITVKATQAEAAGEVLGAAAVRGLEGELEISSPSKVAYRIGLFFVQGFENSIESLKRVDISGILSPALEVAENRARQSREKIQSELAKLEVRGTTSPASNTPSGDRLPRDPVPQAGSQNRRLDTVVNEGSINAAQDAVRARLQERIKEIEREVEAEGVDIRIKVNLVQADVTTDPRLLKIESQIESDRNIELSALPARSIEAYGRFQAEVDRIENELNRADEQLDEAIARLTAPQTETLTTRIKRVLDAGGVSTELDGLGRSLSSIAAGAVGFYGLDNVFDSLRFQVQEAIVNFVELDRSLKTFGVVSQASAKDAAAIRAVMDELSVTTPKTSKEIADAAVELAKAGFNAKQVAGVLPAVVNSSVATGEALQVTGEVVGATIGQFGLFSDDIAKTQKNAARVADLLTAASNASATGVTELGESLKYSATQAKLANQSEKETITNLALLAAAGVKGSSAGTGLAEALRRISLASASATTEMTELRSRGSKQATIAFEKLNIDVRNTEGSLKPLGEILPDIQQSLAKFEQPEKELILNALFGVQGGRSLGALLGLTSEQITQITGQMNAYSGASDRAAVAMQQGLSGAVDQFTSSATLAQTQLAELAGKGLEPLLRGATNLINTFLALPAPLKNTVAISAALGLAFTILTGAIAAYNLLGGATIVASTLKAAAFAKELIVTSALSAATGRLAAINAVLNSSLGTLAKQVGVTKLLSGISSGIASIKNLGVAGIFDLIKTKSIAAAASVRAAAGALSGVGIALAAAGSVALANNVFKGISEGGEQARQRTDELRDSLIKLQAELNKRPEGTKQELKDPVARATQELSGFQKGLDNFFFNPLSKADDALNSVEKRLFGRQLGVEFNTIGESRSQGQIRDQGKLLDEVTEKTQYYQELLRNPNINSDQRSAIIADIESTIGVLGQELGYTETLESARQGTIKSLEIYAEKFRNLGKEAQGAGKQLRAIDLLSVDEIIGQGSAGVGKFTAAYQESINSYKKAELDGLETKEAIEEKKLKSALFRIKGERYAQQELLQNLELKGPQSNQEEEKKRQDAANAAKDRLVQLDGEELDALLEQQKFYSQLKLTQIGERVDEELRVISEGASRQEIAIAKAEEQGLITQAQADKKRSALTQQRIDSELQAEKNRLAQLQEQGPLVGEDEKARIDLVNQAQQKILDLEQQAISERVNARKEAAQQQLDVISSFAQRETDAVTSQEALKQLNIARLEEEGLLTKEQVEQQKAQISIDAIDQELEIERDRLTKLQAIRLSGDEEKDRLQQVRETEDRITQLEIQSIEERKAVREADEQQRLAALKTAQEESLNIISDAATEREILQQRIVNEARAAGVSQSEIAKFVEESEIASRRTSAEQRLAAEQKYLADLEALPTPNDPAIAQQREGEIQSARRETSAVILELLKIEEEAQKRVHEAAIEQINERKIQLDTVKAIADAASGNEQQIISARQRLQQSLAALDEYAIQQRIDGAKTEEEKARLQIQLEQQRRSALNERLALERQSLELSQEKAQLDAEIAVTERQIALEEAIANGESEQQVEQKKKLLALAEQQRSVLSEAQDLELQALSNEQRLAQRQARDAEVKAREQATSQGGGKGGAGNYRGTITKTTEVKTTRIGLGGDGKYANKPLFSSIPTLSEQLKTNSDRLAANTQALLSPTRFADLGDQAIALRGAQSPTPKDPSVESGLKSIGDASKYTDEQLRSLARTEADKIAVEKELEARSLARAQADQDAAAATQGFISSLEGLKVFAGRSPSVTTLSPGPAVKALFTGGPLAAGETATIAELGPELVRFRGGGMTLVSQPGIFRATQSADVYNASDTARFLQQITKATYTVPRQTYAHPANAGKREEAGEEIDRATYKEIKEMHRNLKQLLTQISEQNKPSPFSRPQTTKPSASQAFYIS